MQLRFERALLPGGIAARVLIEVDGDGRIGAIQREVADTGHGFVPGLAVPGMPNLHSHAFQRAMAGTAEVRAGPQGSFWGWREVMYRFVEHLAPADVAAISAFAYMEMLEAGYTSVAEFHYLHHPQAGQPYDSGVALAEAVRHGARATGIRHLLLPCLYQQGNFDGRPLSVLQRRFFNQTVDFIELTARLAAGDTARERTGVALHSLRAVPPQALAAVAVEAARADRAWPVHIHVAEQAREVTDCVAQYGRRPVEYLLESGYLNERWCLVHATHVNATELAGIAASGAVVGLCATTEGNLGDGRFPLDELLAAGGRYGVGSDSQVSIDPREDLRLAEYNLRLWRERRVLAASATVPHVGAAMWRDAVAGGAQALGFAAAGLAVGAPADIVLIDSGRAEFAGVADEALLDAWIFAPRAAPVYSVWVGGELLVAGGRHKARTATEAAYRDSLRRLKVARPE